MKNKAFTLLFGLVFALFPLLGNTPTAQAYGCQINTFYAAPATVPVGNITTLNWGTTNCASVSINNGVGTVTTSGSMPTQSLYGSTYYTLTAYDQGGSTTTSQIFVGVTASNGNNSCVINAFTISPTTVTSGQSATMSWSTSGCTSAMISGGQFYSQYQPASGSISTGPLSGTTTFTLAANGQTSVNRQVTISVSNSQYPYSYQCQPGVYTADPSCANQYASSIITAPASNLNPTSARLNAIITKVPTSFVAYFEYDTTPVFMTSQATPLNNLGNITSFHMYDTISTIPGVTYYYRVVAQIDGLTIRGNPLSFTTPLTAPTTQVYAGGSSSTASTSSKSDTSSSTTTKTVATDDTPAAVTLTITNKKDAVDVGETVENTITYTNATNKNLTNATISIVLPQGFTVKQTTEGMMLSPTTVTANIGTIAPGQTGKIFLEAIVGPNTPLHQTLVTNGTLTYTLPGGVHDTSIGYVINHAGAPNVIAGFALGSGFFPSTIFGWFITLIIILTIILIARRIARSKNAHHGGHGDHGGHGH